MVQGQYFTILDIGSSHMRMLVTNQEDPAQVIAHHEVASEGVAHGAIIDLELAAKALSTLISSVQNQIEYKVRRFHMGLQHHCAESTLSWIDVKLTKWSYKSSNMDLI